MSYQETGVREFDPDLNENILKLLGSMESLPLGVVNAVLEFQNTRNTDRFEGLMLGADLDGTIGKIPYPKAISQARRRLVQLEAAKQAEKEKLKLETERIYAQFGIDQGQAEKLVKSAAIISQDIQARGLLYKERPFNFALTAPYPLPYELVTDIASLSTSSLQATRNLAMQDPQVSFLLNRGSTQLEQKLWQQTDGYNMIAPLNRIDLVDGKVIEFGPTFVDGFATAQVFAEAWGMNAKATDILSETFTDLYKEYCTKRGISFSESPNLGLGFVVETSLMRDEMTALARYLQRSKRFGQIDIGRLRELSQLPLDLVFYYFKPSMIDGWEGRPMPDAKWLTEGPENGICVVPPLKQQMGKKAILALFRMYPEFYIQQLGQAGYERLLEVTTQTTIVTPETEFPTQDSVLKPSSAGSCDGVIGTDDSSFIQQFRQAQADYLDPEKDIWVIQPKLSETVPNLWAKSAKDGLLRLSNPTLKQTLMVAGGRVAGAFATASTKWIIDDSGFGFPCKIIGGNKNDN